MMLSVDCWSSRALDHCLSCVRCRPFSSRFVCVACSGRGLCDTMCVLLCFGLLSRDSPFHCFASLFLSLSHRLALPLSLLVLSCFLVCWYGCRRRRRLAFPLFIFIVVSSSSLSSFLSSLSLVVSCCLDFLHFCLSSSSSWWSIVVSLLLPSSLFVSLS